MFGAADFVTLSGERRLSSQIVCCLIPIKEPVVQKYEGLPRSKILGILQTETICIMSETEEVSWRNK